MRRNSDLQVILQPIVLNEEKHDLFDKHYIGRFNEYNPITVFLRNDSAVAPSEGVEISVYHKGRLVACSTMHLGREAVSSTYAFYDPFETQRSLGIFTMLLEIDFAIRQGKRFFYPGYIYDKRSRMDYKRNFYGMEYYDWNGVWTPFERGVTPVIPDIWPQTAGEEVGSSQ